MNDYYVYEWFRISDNQLRYLIKHSSKTQAIYFNYIFRICTPDELLDIDNTVASAISSGRRIREIPKHTR